MGKGSYSAAVFVIGILTFWTDAVAQAQFTRSCGATSPLSARTATEDAAPPEARAWEFKPSLCVAERYDSNVFYSPPQQGLERDDAVTTVYPSLRITRNGDYVSGYLDIGGFSETYAYHSSLNYLGTANTLNLNLDKSIKRLLPQATLTVTDSVRYTPTPPGFLNPAAGTSPSDPTNPQNPFAQGVLAFRTDNLTNTTAVASSYAITPMASLNASYSYSILRFGGSSRSQFPLLDTTTHTGSVGSKVQLSATDAASITLSHSDATFTSSTTPSTTLPSGSFRSNVATIGWTHKLTPYLTAEMGGGGIVIDPGTTTYAANASLVLTLPTFVSTLGYSRTAVPSYFGTGVVLVSDVVALTAIQKIARQWQLAESANYAHSSGESGSTSISFNTYAASIDLHYWMTEIWSTAVSFDYMNVMQEFQTTSTTFDRFALTFSVKAVLW